MVDGVVEGLGFGVAVVNLVHDDGDGRGGHRRRAAGRERDAARHLERGVDLAGRVRPGRALGGAALPRRTPSRTTRPSRAGCPTSRSATTRTPGTRWTPCSRRCTRSPATLVGVLSVDLPEGGRRPDEVQRALLEMYATQAGIAIDNARLVARVRASEESFRLAFENAPVGMSLVDFTPETSGRFLRVNEAMSRMLGHSRRELETLSIRDVTHPDDHAGDLDVVSQAVAGEIERYQLEKRYLHADGHPVWVSLQTSVVRDGTGTGALRHQPVRGHQRPAGRAPGAHPAGPDRPADRPAQPQRPGRAGARKPSHAARRNQRAGAVLFCDLDDFKPVNDTLGHAFGDQVLAIIAQRLESQVRAGDTTARFGGDEFVIVTDDLSDEEMDDLVDRLRTAVAAPIDVGGTSVALSVTVGSGPGHRQPGRDAGRADRGRGRRHVPAQARCPGRSRPRVGSEAPTRAAGPGAARGRGPGARPGSAGRSVTLAGVSSSTASSISRSTSSALRSAVGDARTRRSRGGRPPARCQGGWPCGIGAPTGSTRHPRPDGSRACDRRVVASRSPPVHLIGPTPGGRQVRRARWGP